MSKVKINNKNENRVIPIFISYQIHNISTL